MRGEKRENDGTLSLLYVTMYFLCVNTTNDSSVWIQKPTGAENDNPSGVILASVR